MCFHVSFQDNKCHMIWIILSLKPLPMYVYTVYYFDLDFWSFNWATNQYIFSMSRPIVLSLTLTLEQSHYQKPGSSQKYMHCNVDNHMPLSYLQCRMVINSGSYVKLIFLNIFNLLDCTIWKRLKKPYYDICKFKSMYFHLLSLLVINITNCDWIHAED